MQTCALCNASSTDQASHCQNCQADLAEFSTHSTALKKFRANSRVQAVTILPGADACSYCYEQLGTYPLDRVPRLPHISCSGENGCRCYYIPILNDIYP